jgi:hypothetical protein
VCRCLLRRRLKEVLTGHQPVIGRTPSQYANVYSRRSQFRHRPAPPPPKSAEVVAPTAPQTERPSTSDRMATCGRRSQRLLVASGVPKSPSPPCDKGPSPPLIDAHVSDPTDDPVANWLTEKRRKQAAIGKRQERRRQADLRFTARLQERQKERNQTARQEERCSSLMKEVESTLQALETAWRQEAERARPNSHRSARANNSTVGFVCQHECEKAGDAVCAPLRAQLRQIHADSQRCNLGTEQRQKSVEQRLEKLQELQTALDNAMVAEQAIKATPSLATSGGLKGLAGLASLAARATARQSPAPITLDDMADDVEFFSRHFVPEDAENDGKPRPLVRGAMRDVMSAYQNVRDNVAWRASIDPTGRHSESLRALSDVGSPKEKLPSSARARAAARRGQPLSSARQSVYAS